MRKNNNSGFIPIIIIFLAVAAITGGLLLAYKKYNPPIIPLAETSSTPVNLISPELQNQVSNQQTSTPIPKPGVKTATPKSTTKATATPSSNSSTTCSYNTTGATGAIKIDVRPQSGILLGDQLAQIDAKAGCNVLVGSSTASYTIRSAGGGTSNLNSISISSIPAGSYSIKVRYKDQWTGSTSINVSSGAQTTSVIYVSGDAQPTTAPTPTPTPKPKPICFNPTTYPTSLGSAPYTINFQPGGDANGSGGLAGYEWDYLNNGSWSSSGANPGTYTFQSTGTYTIKLRVLGANGEYSDTCQTTVTVTQ